ncbi:MAG TPA: hypothetical protein VJN18_32140 [Polyangiaceae bacterium]|nr:hypothetical protein [Polyangiaceae bacterium]
MKRTLSALVLSLGLSVPALASAQELGSKGDAIFSVDRLMGIVGTHRVIETPVGDVETDWTSISFGWRATPEASPFDVPRFAFDYLIIDHLSIGGSLGYNSISFDGDDSLFGQDADFSQFLLAARAGYLHSFGDVVAIWPRGGLTYHSAGFDEGSSVSGLALTLECPFTFSPTRHFAFHVGPSVDFDMFGEIDPQTGPDQDWRYRAIGLNAGILGWF